MPTPIVDVSTFTDPIIRPVDADARNAASVHTPLQGVSNRTRYLLNRVDARTGGTAGTDEWAYDDAPRVRTRVIGPANFFAGSAAIAFVKYWTTAIFVGGGTGLGMTSQDDAAELIADVGAWLPFDATLTRVRVLVQTGKARPLTVDRMTVFLNRTTPNFTTPGIPSYAGPLHQVYDDGTLGNQVITTGVISEFIDQISALHLWIQAGSDAGTFKDDVFAIELQYEDPGPRNL